MDEQTPITQDQLDNDTTGVLQSMLDSGAGKLVTDDAGAGDAGAETGGDAGAGDAGAETGGDAGAGDAGAETGGDAGAGDAGAETGGDAGMSDDALYKQLGEIFGVSVSSVQDLKPIAEQVSAAIGLQQKVEELEKDPVRGYANRSTAQYDQWVRETGLEDSGVMRLVLSEDIDKADAVRVLAINMVMENPNLLGVGLDKVEQKLKEQNKLVATEEGEELDPVDVAMQKAQMNTLAKSARENLVGLKNKLENLEIPSPEGETEEQKQAKVNKLRESWSGSVTKVSSNDKFPIGSTDKGVVFNYGLNEGQRKFIASEIMTYVESNNLEHNEANLAKAYMHAYGQFFAQNQADITAKLLDFGRSLSDEDYLKAMHRPSSERNTDTQGGEESPAKTVEEMTMGALDSYLNS